MFRAVVRSDGSQTIIDDAEYEISVVDLSSSNDSEKALAEYRARLSHRLYQPDVWPTFEIAACKLPAGSYRLFISIDLLHLDLQSLGLIFSDWLHYYFDGEDLTPLSSSFCDYVKATAEFQNQPRYREAWSYWKTHVQQLPPRPDLPVTPAQASSTTRFTRRHGLIEASEWAKIKAAAAKAGVTPSTAALAAYCEVLRLWSVEPDFSVNVTLRNVLPICPDIENVAGVFTSPIPVAARGSDGPTFESRARALHSSVSAALKYRSVNGVEIIREYARSHGNGAGTAVFPVVYTSTLHSRNHALNTLERLGERVYNIIQTPQVFLDLQVYERQSALLFHWDCVEELFPRAVPDEMANAYRQTLSDLADGSAWTRTHIAQLPHEQRLRREHANATAAAIPEITIHELALADVEKRSDAPAVISSSEVMTVGRLNARALAIAHHLRPLEGANVAIVLPKSVEQFAAVTGALYAGCAYVPVPVDLPPSRFQALLRSSEARTAITTRDLAARLPWPSGIERLVIQDIGSENGAITRADLAYILYTSGSTGEPKGVMIEHRSVVNRILDVNRRFGIHRDDSVLALTALHHDLSVYDLFGVIAAGGVAIVPDADKLRDPAHWAALMRGFRVTIWNSVPAYLEMLVTYLEGCGNSETIPTDLRLVLLAGDWIPVRLPDRFRALIPNAQVISLGGPTETTVWDICYPVETVDPSWQSIPYGKPMRNSRYYVMNSAMEERPDWVRGELYIAGAGLARGYWNDPQKTSDKFMTHPATRERLYRSGDLGRWLPGGNIEFLGRSDSQLKVGGNRIEAEEIAAIIRKHPGVDRVVVRAVGDRNAGGMRLAAYVVSRNGETGYDPKRTNLSEAEQWRHRLSQPCRLKQEWPLGAQTLAHQPTSQGTDFRKSCRAFRRGPMSRGSFEKLIECLSARQITESPFPKYRYPSAGSIYPVRAYLSLRAGAVQDLREGNYYYDPTAHSLTWLSDDVPGQEIHVEHNRCLADSAGILVTLVAHLPAITPIYGDVSRDYCLLEAGYIGQLLMTEAAQLQLGICPIGDLDGRRMSRILNLGEQDELVHALVMGLPSRGDDLGRGCAVPESSTSRTEREIRAILRDHLPAHMVPDHIFIMRAFPLTANGKVDLSALPLPSTASETPPRFKLPEPGLRARLRMPSPMSWVSPRRRSIRGFSIWVVLQFRLCGFWSVSPGCIRS